MKIFDQFKIRRYPKNIEYIKNPSSELIEYAISRGYTIDLINIEKFKEFCSFDCFLERFKKDPTFLENLKKIDFTTDLKRIYRIVFDDNPALFLDFYKNNILNNFDSVVSLMDIEVLYMYIIENFTSDEIPQKVLNNKNIISVEENIIKSSNVEGIITFLEKAKTISNNIINLLENQILKNPMEYFYDLNTIIKIMEKKRKDFSEEFYSEYKNSMMDKAIYTDNMPAFLKFNHEYAENVLIQNPKTSFVILSYLLSPGTREKIISKIREEHIIFETIPDLYLYYEDIYLEIIKNNNKVSNIIEITKSDWSHKKLHRLLEYTSYKFHEQTPKIFYEDINYFMDELKKDFSIIRYAPSDMKLSVKEIAEIFELFINQKDIKINDSELLKTNPLVVLNELKEGNINIKEIDISKIKYKEIIDHELQKYESYNSKTDSEFYNIDSYLSIHVDDIETIKKYVELKENNLLNYTIIFEYINLWYNAFLISNNISYFKTIKNKKDIHFYLGGGKLLDLEQIIKDDEFLDYCVQDIKNSDLSPFERYLAVYDIVKNIKHYKKDFNMNGSSSRNIYLILNNNYIVCAGYARLLEDLLKRIGIDATYLITPTFEEDEKHAIVSVKIKDEKYNLDGVYLSDPTMDNPEFSSIEKQNLYGGILFRLKDTPLKTDYKDAEEVDAQYKREPAIDRDALLSAVMTLKKRIFKRMSHPEELELTLVTNLISREKREQLKKELHDLKVGLYKSCLDKKISEIKTIEYSDYVADIFKDEIYKHLKKYNDVDLWGAHLYDDFEIGFRTKGNYSEDQFNYLNINKYECSSIDYTKKIIISPDSTIIDVLNELESTLRELNQLGIIDTKVNENKKTL